jgi:peptide-methionine (R)-S-oxide reductase
MSKISKTDNEWKAQLSSEQYRVTRQAGTEAPYSGEYEQCWDKGQYQRPIPAMGANTM